jgi:hypothetical protein
LLSNIFPLLFELNNIHSYILTVLGVVLEMSFIANCTFRLLA